MATVDRSLFLKTPKDTQALGETLVRTYPPPLRIALIGPLGAGKTELARGMAHALGIQILRSPSFVVMGIHEGRREGERVRLYHLDLYRLEDPSELYILGLEEALHDSRGYVVVEWAEKMPEFLDQADIVIRFIDVQEKGRKVRIQAVQT